MQSFIYLFLGMSSFYIIVCICLNSNKLLLPTISSKFRVIIGDQLYQSTY